jgi:hypothetical protein
MGMPSGSEIHAPAGSTADRRADLGLRTESATKDEILEESRIECSEASWQEMLEWMEHFDTRMDDGCNVMKVSARCQEGNVGQRNRWETTIS